MNDNNLISLSRKITERAKQVLAKDNYLAPKVLFMSNNKPPEEANIDLESFDRSCKESWRQFFASHIKPHAQQLKASAVVIIEATTRDARTLIACDLFTADGMEVHVVQYYKQVANQVVFEEQVISGLGIGERSH